MAEDVLTNVAQACDGDGEGDDTLRRISSFSNPTNKWIQNQITKAKTVLSNAMFQYVLVAYPVWYLSNTPTHQIHAPSVDIPLAKTEQAFFLQR